MYHFQSEQVNNWPNYVRMLPRGSLVKAIDRGDILRDAKIVNPGVYTMLRHHGGPQAIFDGRGFEGYKALARQFYPTFIDETFRTQYAQFTDLVQEWNEYLATSHSGAALTDRINWAHAAAWVWKHEYRTRPEYKHIRLVLVSAPVGNDIHKAFAEIAIEYDCVLSYHAYDKYIDGKRDPHSWRYHCGRWAFMEDAWGLKPDWLHGEAGPYEGVLTGWRHPKVLNGDRNRYVEAVRRWIREISQTSAYREGRHYGFALFTSGSTQEWKYYETEEAELSLLAPMIAQEWHPGTAPEPTPTPTHDGSIAREAYNRTYVLIDPNKYNLEEATEIFRREWQQNPVTLGPSYDDAGIGCGLKSRTVKIYTQDKATDEQILNPWYEQNYPGTKTEYASLAPLHAQRLISPVGMLQNLEAADPFPNDWTISTRYAQRYEIHTGSGIYHYHTGVDLNNNVLSFDADRNQLVNSIGPGRVVYAGKPSTAWQWVVVTRHRLANGALIYARYAHLLYMLVKQGQIVNEGDWIGTIGRNFVTSAGSWGPYHLHFDISKENDHTLWTDPGHWPTSLAEVEEHYQDPVLVLRSWK